MLTGNNRLMISESSPVLHYGQQRSEGLKAYQCADGSANLLRPNENVKRLQKSCARLLMPQVPIETLVPACQEVVETNLTYLSPYGTGGTLHLRPYMIGVGDNIGIAPVKEYIFSIFCVSVDSYFKNGSTPASFVVSEHDRAANRETEVVKVGGDYAASLPPGAETYRKEFSDYIYSDPYMHTKTEEAGAASFFDITKDGAFIAPKPASTLSSITKYSLLTLAEERLGTMALGGDVYVDRLTDFSEADACGTAAIISPTSRIQNGTDFHVSYSETKVGPVTKQLYDELVGIQFGGKGAPEGWVVKT